MCEPNRGLSFPGVGTSLALLCARAQQDVGSTLGRCPSSPEALGAVRGPEARRALGSGVLGVQQLGGRPGPGRGWAGVGRASQWGLQHRAKGVGVPCGGRSGFRAGLPAPRAELHRGAWTRDLYGGRHVHLHSPRRVWRPPPPRWAGPCPSDVQDGVLVPGRSLESDKSAERRSPMLEAEFIVEKSLSNYCQL